MTIPFPASAAIPATRRGGCAVARAYHSANVTPARKYMRRKREVTTMVARAIQNPTARIVPPASTTHDATFARFAKYASIIEANGSLEAMQLVMQQVIFASIIYHCWRGAIKRGRDVQAQFNIAFPPAPCGVICGPRRVGKTHVMALNAIAVALTCSVPFDFITLNVGNCNSFLTEVKKIAEGMGIPQSDWKDVTGKKGRQLEYIGRSMALDGASKLIRTWHSRPDIRRQNAHTFVLCTARIARFFAALPKQLRIRCTARIFLALPERAQKSVYCAHLASALPALFTL